MVENDKKDIDFNDMTEKAKGFALQVEQQQ